VALCVISPARSLGVRPNSSFSTPSNSPLEVFHIAIRLPKAADEASHMKKKRMAIFSEQLLLVLSFENSSSIVCAGNWEVFLDEYIFVIYMRRRFEDFCQAAIVLAKCIFSIALHCFDEL
jgi:hypothetical protein